MKNKQVCQQNYIPYTASTRAASQTFAFYPKWKSGDDFQSLLSQDFVELSVSSLIRYKIVTQKHFTKDELKCRVQKL